MATDQLGAETRRYTLLIEPGRRYREQGENHVSGCDGDRSWFAVRDADGWKAGADDGWTVEGDDGPEPLMPQMMCPSWLLTGYTLEAGESVTAGGREALRVVATPRPGSWPRGSARPRRLDRAVVLVDLGLGILLRHEEILDGRTLSVTELTEIRLDPGPAGDDRFAAAGRLGFRPRLRAVGRAEGTWLGGGQARWRGWPRAVSAHWSGPRGPGPSSRPRRRRPEAEMPPDPEPLPADAPAVTDQMLHLLHDSRDRWATGITATLHQWHDMAAMLAQVPDGARRAGVRRARLSHRRGG